MDIEVNRIYERYLKEKSKQEINSKVRSEILHKKEDLRKKVEKLKQSISLLDGKRKDAQNQLLLKGILLKNEPVYFLLDQISTKLAQGIEELNSRKHKVNSMLNQVENVEFIQKENLVELIALNRS